MTTLQRTQADLQAAMKDYRTARNSLDHHRGLAKHGIANALAHAVAAEHSAFYRLERAQAAYTALQPAPQLAPKPVAAVTKPAPIAAPKVSLKPAAPVTPKPAASNMGSFDLLGHLNDQIGESRSRMLVRCSLPPVRHS